MLGRLEPPRGVVPVVIDSDAFNEIDDQFAIGLALLSDEIRIEAIQAAPFCFPPGHPRSGHAVDPADGMEKSYREILNLVDLLDRPCDIPLLRGSPQYLSGSEAPVESEAARDLARRAMADREGPLYVCTLGAATNVASAILIEPKIIERIVVVWLAGHDAFWPETFELNMSQDPHASRIVFDCGVPLVRLPVKVVTDHLRTTLPEIALHVKGRGRLGDYLHRIFAAYVADWIPGRAKALWDCAAIAYCIDPQWVMMRTTTSPRLEDDGTLTHSPDRHLCREALYAQRDAIFGDLFRKLDQLT